MPKSDFIPTNDNDFLAWHDRYRAALSSIGATVGVTAAEITEATGDNTALRTKISGANAANAAAQQATRDRQTTRQKVENDVRKLVRRVKAHSTYTTALGEKLGIEGPEDTTDLTQAKPVLKANARPHGVVEVQFHKSKSDGVNLYCQRDGDGAFVFLARDTASPYVDNRPLLAAGKPEVRKYKAIYVVNDAEIGQASDEVVVTCQP